MTALLYRNGETYRSAPTYRGIVPPLVDPGIELRELQGVLNQLANTSDLAEDGAANAWNRQTYADAPYLSLIGALNYLNGSYGLGLNDVCNQLASTHGLSAQGALNKLAGNW